MPNGFGQPHAIRQRAAALLPLVPLQRFKNQVVATTPLQGLRTKNAMTLS
jgi:hypothetical protein